MEMRQEIGMFLDAHGMNPGGWDLCQLAEAYRQEMGRGLAGEKSSLMMIPTYLTVPESIERGRPVLAMDAGGTNMRVALFSLDEAGHPVLDHFHRLPMPGSRGKLSRIAFCDAVVDAMEPLLDRSDTVGLTFSFPTEILPDHDGRLLHFDKEVEVDGMDGQLLGASFNERLQARGYPPKRWVVLNDTAAVLLGCLAGQPASERQAPIGLIYGTGINTCYLEDNRRITKSPLLCGRPGHTIINMEAGGFTGFPRGDFDRMLDRSTRTPGDFPYEKMVSGRYLPQLMALVLEGAIEEGLFSTEFASHYRTLPPIGLREVDALLDGTGPLCDCCTGEAEHAALEALLTALYDRAATLVAVNLAAILLETGDGRDPAHPAVISVDGTTYLRSPTLQRCLLHRLEALTGALGRHCRLEHAPDLTLTGTGIAALTIVNG